jgi:putative SOS response-associated peptidase YedK
MCYRYVLQREALEALATRLAVPTVVDWSSRFNLAPGEAVPVVRQRVGANGRSLELVKLRWGLLPAWTKETATAPAPANARAESLASRPMFREAFRRRRCVVPASGFYEWRGQDRHRQPYLFRGCGGAPLCFAGLWESWRGREGGPPVESCAIVTTPPNDLVRPIHDRMPAILTAEETERWLDPRLTEPGELESFLHPISADAMTVISVTTRVNNTRFDDPACLEPAPSASGRDEPGQLSLGF